MRVIVYDKNTSADNFNNYGYGIVHYVTSCKVIEELNGRYEAELVVDLSENKLKYITKWSILRIGEQLFRVFNTKKTDNDNSLTVFARHIFYDLDYGFIEDIKRENVTMEEALQGAITSDFAHFKITSDIADKNTRYLVKENGVQAIFKIIERWEKGEILRDNFNIAVNSSMGKDSGVTFTYKKIEGIEVIEDTDEVITRLFPTGKEGIKLQEKFIYIPNWNEEDFLPFHITKEVVFDEAENEGDLRILAQKYAERVGLSKVNLQINVNDLLGLDIYEDLKGLMWVDVGDLVTVKHPKLNIRVKMKVIKKEHEIVTDKVVIELGEAVSTFFDNLGGSGDGGVSAGEIVALRNELFYYFNGADIVMKTIEMRYASMKVATSKTTNLMLHLSINPNISVKGQLKLKINVNNVELQYSPIIDLVEGYSVQTISFPIIALEGGQTQVVRVLGEFTGKGVIEMNRLHLSITGQDVNKGLIKVEPFTGALIEYDLDTQVLINQSDVNLDISTEFKYSNRKCINNKKPIPIIHTVSKALTSDDEVLIEIVDYSKRPLEEE